MGANDVASPTFAIHHEYTSPGGMIDHVDLYRVKTDEDLEGSGFWDLLRNPQALLFVEWADRLPEEVWPEEWMRVFLRLDKGVEEEARRLNWEVKPGR